MKVVKSKQGSVWVFRPEGALVVNEVDDLGAEIRQVDGLAHGRVVLDMAAVPYLDSVGMEAMLDMSDTCQESGRKLSLANVSATAREIMDLTDILDSFEIFSHTDDAIRSYL